MLQWFLLAVVPLTSLLPAHAEASAVAMTPVASATLSQGTQLDSMMAPSGSPPTPEASPTKSRASSTAFGMKAAIVVARSWLANKTYAPMMSLQFDGRIGSRNAFVEFAAGATMPTTSVSPGNGEVRMGGVFAEFGGNVYLSDGGVAPYIGGGVSPRLWYADQEFSCGPTFAVYGQAGIDFTRDSPTRLYVDLRLSQFVFGLSRNNGSDEVVSGVYDSSVSNYYPVEMSVLLGIGW